MTQGSYRNLSTKVDSDHFHTNAGKTAMEVDAFTFQEAEPGLDGDIICTTALSGDTMNDPMFLEECDIASGCKL